MNARLYKMAGCMRRLMEPLLPSDVGLDALMSGEDVDFAIPDFVLLPVTRFSTEEEADAIWEQVAKA